MRCVLCERTTDCLLVLSLAAVGVASDSFIHRFHFAWAVSSSFPINKFSVHVSSNHVCIPKQKKKTNNKNKKRTNRMQKIYKFIDCVCMRVVLKRMETNAKRWNETRDVYRFHVRYLYLSAFEYRSMRMNVKYICIICMRMREEAFMRRLTLVPSDGENIRCSSSPSTNINIPSTYTLPYTRKRERRKR